MKLKPLKMLPALFMFLLAPATSHAVPFYYSAQGSIVDNQGNTLQISGGMNIDNQLRSWDGGGPGQPVGVADDLGQQVYQYYITGYSLTVGNYTFSGDGGNLYMPLNRFPTLNDWGTGDLMWFLRDGVGAWNKWTGEQFAFFNANGTSQDPSQYINLPSLIQLTGFDYLFGDPILPAYSPDFRIWLTQEPSAPVPEPATVILLGASLLGLLGYRKVRR